MIQPPELVIENGAITNWEIFYHWALENDPIFRNTAIWVTNQQLSVEDRMRLELATLLRAKREIQRYTIQY